MTVRIFASAGDIGLSLALASLFAMSGAAQSFAQTDPAPIPRPVLESEAAGEQTEEDQQPPVTEAAASDAAPAEKAPEPEAATATDGAEGATETPTESADGQTGEDQSTDQKAQATSEPASAPADKSTDEAATEAASEEPPAPTAETASDSTPQPEAVAQDADTDGGTDNDTSGTEARARDEVAPADASPQETVDTGPYIAPGFSDVLAEYPILRTPDEMPEAVRRTWTALRDAARSGDIEALRPLIEAQDYPPTLSFAAVDDPILYMRSISGDAEGREILAILLEVLEMGYRHIDVGTKQEMYVWPYYVQYPLSRLTPEQTVEMFTLLTAGDYQDMVSYGAYIFFRVGIGPDGVWHFFVAGD